MEWIKSWDSRKSLNTLDLNTGANTATIKERCLLSGQKYFNETRQRLKSARDKEFEEIVYSCYFLLKNYDCKECSDKSCNDCSSFSCIKEYDKVIESLAFCEGEKEKIADMCMALFNSFLLEYVSTHLFEEPLPASEKMSLWELYKKLTICEEEKTATAVWAPAPAKEKKMRRKQLKEQASDRKNFEGETRSSCMKKCTTGTTEKIPNQHWVVLPYKPIAVESWNEIENQYREPERKKADFEKELKEQEKRMKIKEKKMKRKKKKALV